MQNDDNHNNSSPSRQQGQGDSGGDDKTSRGSWHDWSAGDTLTIPTKNHDGGGMDIPANPNANGEGEQQSNGGGGGSEATTTTTATSTSRPDNFLTYSDNDTRMRALLGLEPPSNPNDGEEQEDWRQIIGFQGLGGRRHQRQNNDARDAAAQAQAAPVNGDGEAAGSRRTRLSWELHPSAFDFEFDIDEQPPRVERQQRGHGHGRGDENRNGRDDNNEE